MKKCFNFLILIAPLLWATGAYGQAFQLKNGQTVIGDIKRESADFYILNDAGGGTTVVLKSKISTNEFHESTGQSVVAAAESDGAQKAVEVVKGPPPLMTRPEYPENPAPIAARDTVRASTQAHWQVYSWVDGQKGYEKAMKWRQAAPDPLILYFYTNWSSDCKKFKNGILNDSRVNDALENVVKVSVNADAERELAEQFGVQSYPAFLVVSVYGQAQQIRADLSRDEFLKACQVAGLRVKG